MAAASLIGLYSLGLCTLYGLLAVWLTGKAAGKVFAPPSLTTVWLAGLCVVSALASILSLFMRLGLEANLILLAGAAAILAWLWKAGRLKWERLSLSLHPLAALAGLLCLLIVLEIATQRANNPDTGIYHAQAIRWIETYPVVPGLGNLHTRFAYNSSWLVANALFSFAFTGLRSFHLLPGVFYLVFLWGLAAGVNRLLKGGGRPSDIFQLMLLPAAIYTQGNAFSSPGTDFPAILLTWILIMEWMRWMEEEAPRRSFRPYLLALLAASALTVKLSTAPLLLLAAGAAVRLAVEKEWKGLLAMAALGALALLPWTARNVALSGYPVFPEPSIDLFAVDWKIPPDIAAAEKESIESWAKIPRLEVATVQTMPLREWATTWYYNQTANRKAMLWGIPVLLGGFLLFSLLFPARGRALLKRLRSYSLAYATALLGVIFWFLNAPSFRFGIGWVTAALLLGLLPWALLAAGWFKRPALLWRGAAAVILAYLGLMLAQSFQAETFAQRLLYPADYIRLPTHPCEFSGFTVMCADSYQECWYDPFPCVPGGNPQVEMRGETFRQGFRWIR